MIDKTIEKFTPLGNKYSYCEEPLSLWAYLTGKMTHAPFIGYTIGFYVHIYRLKVPFGKWIAKKTRRHEEKHVDINAFYALDPNKRDMLHKKLDRITFHGLLDWRWSR